MLTALVMLAVAGGQRGDALAEGFRNPPLSARPHTWWHWMNGNVTKEGITADLEAMKQVGIGGAQMFTVDQGIPAGPAKYAGPIWREMTAFAVKEAARLGLELCIHNGAGWSSSGGPWVQPEDAMQVIAWSEVKIQGPKSFSDTLPPIKAPQVDSFVPFRRDIAVYAYPTPAVGDTVQPRPTDFLQRTGVERGDRIAPDLTPAPAGIAIPQKSLLTLTGKMDSQGKLTWDVPNGSWTILRVGYVPTGVHNHPAPPEGDGLEVDKLSKEALAKHWNALVGKVISDIGPQGLKTLDDVLIDSYEVGSQNWSPKFREDFKRLRGYDPLPYLPVIAGRIIDSKEVSERFLWDLRRTIADLYAANYYGGFRELTHKNGMIFSTEPYGNGGFDNIQSGAAADIPMAEFWLGGGMMETTKMVSSIGHTYGRPIVGAESFTGDVAPGRWLEEPYALKALGDKAFCNGINRYIFHRYAMQPWLNLKPGMTMGPWGTHIERTQTWWTEAAAWMKYIARCQYLLQAGQFQADVCYYQGADGPNDLPYNAGLKPNLGDGWDYDGCDTAVLLNFQVRNGKLVLPSGMSYKLLVLPESPFMTPEVAQKLKQLVAAGATIYGPKPKLSPSLSGYPECDDMVRRIGDELWGTVFGDGPLHHGYGKGNVIYNENLPNVLTATLKTQRDFEYTHPGYGVKLAEIHRKIGEAEVYFVSNQRNVPGEAICTFRVTGKIPELWHPETGKMEEVPAYEQLPWETSFRISFDTAESVFVVFRKPAPKLHLATLWKETDPRDVVRRPNIVIMKARYESADGRGADVTDTVRRSVLSGNTEIIAANDQFGDPVPNVVKHLVVEYYLNNQPKKQTVAENETMVLTDEPRVPAKPKSFAFKKISDHEVEITSWTNAGFFAADTGGQQHRVFVQGIAQTLIRGPWSIAFPPNLGAPATAEFPELISWTASDDPGIKYFSGSAVYTKEFQVPDTLLKPGQDVRLNLGAVKNFATVTLNGKSLGILWKPPFVVDVSGLLKSGNNKLEVKVTNLWVNRIIGDEQLPPDVEWQDGHLKQWPDWLLQGKPRPNTGRITFETWHFWDKNSPLLDSGLLGPVTIEGAGRATLRY